jgi:hypothetical protein
MNIFFQSILTLLFILSTSLIATEIALDPALVKEENDIIRLTNLERKKAGLGELRPNGKLTAAARAHSANMAKQGIFSHELDGKDHSKRIQDAGYDWISSRENIAFNQKSAADVVKAWMHSPGHRENILAPEITEIGVGIVKNDKGEPYFTQDFGRPKSEIVKVDFSIRNDTDDDVSVDFISGKASVIKPGATMLYELSSSVPDPVITVHAGSNKVEVKVRNDVHYKVVKNGTRLEVQESGAAL